MAKLDIILEQIVGLRGDISRTEQKVDSLNERLFDADSGAVPALWGAYRGTKVNIEAADTCAKEAKATVTAVQQKMDTQKAYIMGYASGASLVLTAAWFIAKAALVKLGWIH